MLFGIDRYFVAVTSEGNLRINTGGFQEEVP